MFNRHKTLSFVTLMALLVVVVTGPSPAVANVSSQVSPRDKYTPTRVDPGLDIIEIRATETSTALNDNWDLNVVTNAVAVSYPWPAAWIYGLYLDANEDGLGDFAIVGPTDYQLGQARASLVRLSDKTELCSVNLNPNSVVIDLSGLTIRQSVQFQVPKTCLPMSQSIGINAYALNSSSRITDSLPEAGFIRFKQPWVQVPLPNPVDTQRPSVIQVKALVSAFPVNGKTLSLKQKSEIKAILKKYSKVISIGCSTYVKGGASDKVRVTARTQAKSVCSYFKEIAKEIEITNFESTVELSNTSVLGKTRVYLNLNNSDS